TNKDGKGNVGYDTANYSQRHACVAGRGSSRLFFLLVPRSAAHPALFLFCTELSMISIQLPDGSKREYPGPVTVAEVAQSIGSGLAKAAIAGRIGAGQSAHVVDTSFRIDRDTPLSIVTEKDPAGLDVIRHST